MASKVSELQHKYNSEFKGSGLSQSTVHRLERGDEEHNKVTTLIALACGVNPVWLAEGRGEMLLHPSQRMIHPSPVGDSSPSVEDDQERTIPLIRYESLSEYLNSPEPLQEEWVEQWLQPIIPVPEGVQSFAMRVQGESMASEFSEDDLVIFIKHEGVIDDLQNKFILCRNAGQGFSFRKLTKSRGGWVLRPENPSYQERKYQKDFNMIFMAIYKYKEYL
ncbi:MAG: hypothetical protein G8345_02395 [Magnetococcales bacterium]|nr:hypothetical protein [Magnetococcales bacterium]